MENAPIPLEGQFPLALRSRPQRAVGVDAVDKGVESGGER